MFPKLACLLLLALFNIVAPASSTFSGDSTAKTLNALRENHNHKLQHIYNNQHKLHRSSSSKQIHKILERPKRGIVLIDEDLNVKLDTSVPKKKNDKEHFDSKVDTNVKSSPRMFYMSEGSGSSEVVSDKLIPIRSFTTTGNVQKTRLFDQKATTGRSDKISVKKSTRFAGPDNPQRESTTGEDEDIEASGDDDLSMVIDFSRTTVDEETASKYASPSTEDPDPSKVTEDDDSTSKYTSPSPEDITSSKYTTDKITSTSKTLDVTETPTKDIHDEFQDLCLNITCDSKDLIILPNLSKAVPEGTNLTLACVLPNVTEPGLLKWYKFNSSEPLLLEENTGNNSVNFAITSTVLHHSGTYVCFKFTEELCCSKKLEITVYKVPNYKKHLIVVGGIAVASFALCTVIAICKCRKAKNYEKKKIDLQNVEKPFLL